MASGADIETIDDDGDTPLHLATCNPRVAGKSVHIVKLLVGHQANITVLNRKGRTPAYNAFAKCRIGSSYYPAVLCVLLRAGGGAG